MGSHPVNLGIRFLLELCALAAMGFWGWRQSEGGLRILLAIATPAVAAVLWGVLAVPGDPSRSGSALWPTVGWARLTLEITFFAFALWALFDLGYRMVPFVFAVFLVLHYAASYDRIIWLLTQ